MLVSYSDSENSDDEQQSKTAQTTTAKPTIPPSNSNFAVDRSTGKIKVNLQSKIDLSSNNTHEDEPAAKRPRFGEGGGAFSNFNAMLPAPKRDNLPATQNGGSKAPTRKVFHLKTGAEPAFSRESDAELKESWVDQDTNDEPRETKADATIPKPSFAKPAPPAPVGKTFMFKPLSVARNNKKKKPMNTPVTPVPTSQPQTQRATTLEKNLTLEPPKKQKISLFSAGTDTASSLLPDPDTHDDNEDEIIEDLGPATDSLDTFPPAANTTQFQPQPQSLSDIATDLNLTPAERRRLFGRTGAQSNANPINVVNFNTDTEYAANQALIASGETVQHNPVRAIASGKHSLKALVSSAAGQREALEESFAAGRRNKREAGSKYGW